MQKAPNPSITDPELAMDTVNSQITDAVTQANVKVLGEAPAMAMGSIYQSLADSTGLAFQNAVSAQHQLNALSQAATAQGVMQLYSVDVVSSALATTSVDTGPAEALTQRYTEAHVALQSQASGLNAQIVEAVEFSNAATLDNADAFAHALRVSTAAAAAALSALSRITQEAQTAILKNAARTACIACMLRAPEKADEYAKVLASIEQL
jgi:hypothetical protein